MRNLYELAGEYAQLLGRLDECETPEEAREILGLLENVSTDVCEKAEAYARIIQDRQRESEGYSAEISRLQARKAAADSIVERLKGNLLTAMLTADATEIATTIGKWTLRRNPVSVVVTDESRVPEAYRVPQPAKIDRRALLAAHRETGEIFPGVEFVQARRVDFR